MSKNNMPGGDNGYDAEEMTVDLDLEDGTTPSSVEVLGKFRSFCSAPSYRPP